ncbi:TniB family NTP-binding protein [Pseudomonas aeruginosa]
MTDKTFLAVVSELDRLVIQHPEFERAFNGVKECAEKSEYYAEPVGCLLSAEGGMGKTTICRTIMSTMPSGVKRLEDCEKNIVPAFYAEVPSPATVKTVAASMLSQLNDPNPLVGNTAQLTERLCKLLEQCETKLVFLDELHNLLDTSKSRARFNTNVCNWIKSIVNNTSVSFCLVGLPEVSPILSIDSQLSRRFPLHYKLGRLTIGGQNLTGTLSPFLATVANEIKRIMKFQATPDFSQYELTLRIYTATSGNPAFIMSLMKESCLLALKENQETLEIHNFKTAWDKGIVAKSSLTTKNPFCLPISELSKALGPKHYAG